MRAHEFLKLMRPLFGGCPDGSPSLRLTYFHAQIFATVLPEGSTSYSKAPQVLFSCASFCEEVRKKSMPR